MDVLDLLDKLEDMIENSTSIPITGKIVANKGDLLDMLKEIRLKLPDDLKQAKWITDQKQKILIDAQRQAEALVKETDTRLKREIEHHDITVEANRRSGEIIANAQKNAKEIRLGAKEYADQLLCDLENGLNSRGKDMSEKLQKDTAESLETINNDIIELVNSIEKQVNDRLGEVRENIKELRKTNG